ncbi:MAG: anaerobic ribonucleoside-triphosphate reductase activating protein [Candidatus Bathyarchaeota archaeon]|nr:anaerobic ribonucleoside-triphosphate reductase activating protein [Candidatus Bathyarchaeota archaeon]MDH5712947.1 anaerobic ribonucleoside-triphosphate reductase activating protein [Candidatus Bathyarchaeota archaeon]
MEIKGFVDLSLVDWDGKISSVAFLAGCNLRCPFCYNVNLVLHPEKLPTTLFEQIEERLNKSIGWVEGVVITGGEPTINSDLPNLCQKIKKLGFLVKVDTNGTNPVMIQELINRKLVDYVAMDIKAPLTKEKYFKACGVNTGNLLEKIEKTIDLLLKDRVEYEFRTTVVPGLHDKQDIEEICQRIKGCRKYVIQNYKGDVETIDPKFKNSKPFLEEEMKRFLTTAKKIIPNTTLRGFSPLSL